MSELIRNGVIVIFNIRGGASDEDGKVTDMYANGAGLLEPVWGWLSGIGRLK